VDVIHGKVRGKLDSLSESLGGSRRISLAYQNVAQVEMDVVVLGGDLQDPPVICLGLFETAGPFMAAGPGEDLPDPNGTGVGAPVFASAPTGLSLFSFFSTHFWLQGPAIQLKDKQCPAIQFFSKVRMAAQTHGNAPGQDPEFDVFPVAGVTAGPAIQAN